MIWQLGDMSSLNQMPNINRGIEAFREVEFVCASGGCQIDCVRVTDERT